MIDPTPLLTAPVHIQIHAAAAGLALILGPVALYGRPGGGLHKATGYVWVGAMAVTAISSFLIHDFGLIGPVSPIHLLSVLALWSLWTGLRQALAGRIRAHRLTMQSLYWRGLIVAGVFNFLPGRSMNRVFLDGRADLGWLVVGLGVAAIGGDVLRRRLQRRRVAAIG